MVTDAIVSTDAFEEQRWPGTVVESESESASDIWNMKMKTGNVSGVAALLAVLFFPTISPAVAQPPEQTSVVEKILAKAPTAEAADASPAAATRTAEPPDPASVELPQILPTKNEVSVSGDYLYGRGTITFPQLFSLQKSGLALSSAPNVGVADRKSDYLGGTLSYSFGQAWFLDLSYAHGRSRATGPIRFPVDLGFFDLPTVFTINDDWYQAYARYTFPGLRFTRFSAYLRAGVSFVQADLHAINTYPQPSAGLYEQTDRTEDILGNVGFGVVYSLYTSQRIKLGLQLEGEGSYGHRSQDSRENAQGYGPYPIVNAEIDNDLYGGIGRSTVRFEYALGRSGRFKLSADGGMEVRYTIIDYSDSGLGTHDELLWGPYAKIGLRYSF